LYQSLFGTIGQAGIFDSAISQMVQNCPVAISDVNNPSIYSSCDPTNGAFARKNANLGEDNTIQTLVGQLGQCSGSTRQNAITQAGSAMVNAFNAHMQQVGVPGYGSIGAYSPAYSSIFYPVLKFDHNRDTFQVNNCTWVTNVYQRADNPYAFPR
jgi:hypothetical protein